jgi:hypothetical protein
MEFYVFLIAIAIALSEDQRQGIVKVEEFIVFKLVNYYAEYFKWNIGE